MCIIIAREPKFEIPQDKLFTAIENNPDGYGIAYPVGDNRLEVVRSPSEPDPENLMTFLEHDVFDENVLLHLRYTTKGATNLRNSHPFPLLERDKDGIDIRIAHNGTIHSFSPKGTDTSSDTRLFVRDFARPLFKRMAKVMEPEELIGDEMTQTILSKMIPSASVLTLIDGQGKFMIVNPTGNGGKKEEGWYYSNTYSFNPTHRTPTNYGYSQNYAADYYGSGAYGKGGGTSVTNFPAKAGTTKTTQKSTQPTTTSTGGRSSATKGTRLFSEKYDIDQSELLLLSDTMIDKLVIDEPEDATLLIKELIMLNYTNSNQVERQAKSLKEAKSTIESLRSKLQ